MQFANTTICNCPRPAALTTSASQARCRCCEYGHRDPQCPGNSRNVAARRFMSALVKTPTVPNRSRGKRRENKPRWQRG